MFCPQCKCEYREGFTQCSDCKVLLVDTLPTEITDRQSSRSQQYIEYQLIRTTFGTTELSQIKAIFDSEGIIYFIQGEDVGIAPGGLQPRILVKKEQAEEAAQLLMEFNLL